MPMKATLNGITIGPCDDTPYVLTEDNVDGLGMPNVKAANLDRVADHGIVSPEDFLTTRILTIPGVIHEKDDPEQAMILFRALKTAWRPGGPVDSKLVMEIPGYGPTNDLVTFYGRARGSVTADLSLLYTGTIFFQCQFECLDPIGYGPAFSTVGTPSTFTLDNPGDAPTDRAKIVVVGNGGKPIIKNITAGGGNVSFLKPVAAGVSVVIDLRKHTVVSASGTDIYAYNVSASSYWFKLLSGINTIQVSGLSSATFTTESGWW